MADPILVAQHGGVACELLLALANRHGLINGATGTGKTITLQTLAENFSKLGMSVFMADVKGDLTGITQAGSMSPRLAAILKERGLELPPCLIPTGDRGPRLLRGLGRPRRANRLWRLAARRPWGAQIAPPYATSSRTHHGPSR